QVQFLAGEWGRAEEIARATQALADQLVVDATVLDAVEGVQALQPAGGDVVAGVVDDRDPRNLERCTPCQPSSHPSPSRTVSSRRPLTFVTLPSPTRTYGSPPSSIASAPECSFHDRVVR